MQDHQAQSRSKVLVGRRVIGGVLGGVCFLIVFALLTQGGKEVLERVPEIRELYFWYYNVRFRLKTPVEVGDGMQAMDILLKDPMGIGQDGSGNVYISDRGYRFIWKIETNGKARVIAGTGRKGSALSGVSALESDLGSPQGLCVDRQNRIYFADSANHIVLRIEKDGILTRIAGTGLPGYGGDGGRAIHASLNKPYDVRLDSEENIYIADMGNHRIRMVTREGVIHTVAGIGEPGYSGDHGPAVASRLKGPYGIFLDSHDRLLIADSSNHVIRRVDRNGIITTIAGVGHPGYGGDGGPANAAMFDKPESLYVDEAGSIYVGDEHNHVIRVIDPDGTISTLLGTGTPGLGGDGIPASQAQLNDPENVMLRSDGSILITEGGNARVRMMKPNDLVETFAGRGERDERRAQTHRAQRYLAIGGRSQK